MKFALFHSFHSHFHFQSLWKGPFYCCLCSKCITDVYETSIDCMRRHESHCVVSVVCSQWTTMSATIVDRVIYEIGTDSCLNRSNPQWVTPCLWTSCNKWRKGCRSTSSKPIKFKQFPYKTWKMMATAFWDDDGVLLVEFLERGTTVTAVRTAKPSWDERSKIVGVNICRQEWCSSRTVLV